MPVSARPTNVQHVGKITAVPNLARNSAAHAQTLRECNNRADAVWEGSDD